VKIDSSFFLSVVEDIEVIHDMSNYEPNNRTMTWTGLLVGTAFDFSVAAGSGVAAYHVGKKHPRAEFTHLGLCLVSTVFAFSTFGNIMTISREAPYFDGRVRKN
jgi:hypothetical protein